MKATTINDEHLSKSGFGARAIFYILLLSILGLSKIFASKSDDSIYKFSQSDKNLTNDEIRVVNSLK